MPAKKEISENCSAHISFEAPKPAHLYCNCCYSSNRKGCQMGVIRSYKHIHTGEWFSWQWSRYLGLQEDFVENWAADELEVRPNVTLTKVVSPPSSGEQNLAKHTGWLSNNVSIKLHERPQTSTLGRSLITNIKYC